MKPAMSQVQHLRAGTMKIEVHPSRASAGAAAAHAAAGALQQLKVTRDVIGVIFATGASQFDTLEALTSIADLPWNRISGFHMDEYVGISADHPASFRRYLREKLTLKVSMREFFEVDGSALDPVQTCRDYAEKLRSADPQLCLLGIGENGHLAFNDPPVADFDDPLDVKVVRLDALCREQQTAEGWFARVEDVPEEAITLTIPALLRVPKLIVSVPGPRKAAIMRRTIKEDISTACPATILRTHPDVTVYLDEDSSAELDDLLAM
ncbi:Glucosamine-6-phosphate deaminase [Acidisarcina polymorpha]|uniref:Glucosamine-6-phosphate deaminase n=1 Tax=Acidisarcina polymorpha TaxID=2211140 RepID=A0A2Z5FSH1_9BACT|nr:glucosamine-6-phosphate deaminase [Acidisarcina polymorpha]AXC09788.1 Glucosamine-6-phosphate deaminase [Acidisarcina polymorpha]